MTAHPPTDWHVAVIAIVVLVLGCWGVVAVERDDQAGEVQRAQ